MGGVMKLNSIVVILCLMVSSNVWTKPRPRPRSETLADGMQPANYRARTDATLNVALVYYGHYWSESDMQRLVPLLKQRFEESTNHLVKLNIAHTGALPYKHQITDYPDYRSGDITDPARLQRLWYYDNMGPRVLAEVYEEFKASDLGRHYENLDALLVVSGAQYDALGFASGRVAITEQPREIAWGLPDGGRTEIVSDENLVDELVHELGHVMFLGHSSTRCQAPNLTLEQRQACCEVSPARNDVMSYCRDRRQVDEDFFFKFESCNLGMIEQLIVPAMLEGKQWNVPGRVSCP